MERRVTRSSSRSSPSSESSSSATTARNWRRTRTSEKQPHQDSDKENAPPLKNTKNDNTTTTSEETCGICLEIVKEKGELNCCLHSFCFECIFQWSKTSNTCPMCKARFVSLRKLEQGKPRRGKSYKVEDVDHRQDDSDFEGWISSEDEDYDGWEDLDAEPDHFWMYNGFYYNDPFLIDLTEGDDEDDEDVQTEEEEDEDASEGDEEGAESESDDQSGADSDCYIIENISDGEDNSNECEDENGEDEDEGENEEAPQTPRRSTRLQRSPLRVNRAQSDVEMDEDADADDSVGARVAQRHRTPLNERQRSLRSNTPRRASINNNNNTQATRSRRSRTTTAPTSNTQRRRTRRNSTSEEGTGLRKSARLASRMDVG